MDHYEHLMTERMKYTWISSANKAGVAEPLGMFGGYLPTSFFQLFCFGLGISFFLLAAREKILKTKAVVILIISVKRLCPETILPFTTKAKLF